MNVNSLGKFFFQDEVDQLVKERAQQEVVAHQRDTLVRELREEITSLKKGSSSTSRVDRTTSTSQLAEQTLSK